MVRLRFRGHAGRALALAGPLALGLLLEGGAWEPWPARAQGDGGTVANAPRFAGHFMTDAEMARRVAEYYAAHPNRGRLAPATAPAGDPADTVLVSSFLMNSDGNTGTQFDTVTVIAGESVLFQWVSGSHTTTNGTGPLDPGAGLIWDEPMTSTAPRWVQPFPSDGLFPFFCRPHSGTMKGWVKVLSAVGATPLPGEGARIGFVAAPFPNPTGDRVTFRFALAQPGRARAEVLDVRGRRVSVVIDQELGAGTFGAAWDGRTRGGVKAAPGVYRLLLALPGLVDSRQLVVTR